MSAVQTPKPWHVIVSEDDDGHLMYSSDDVFNSADKATGALAQLKLDLKASGMESDDFRVEICTLNAEKLKTLSTGVELKLYEEEFKPAFENFPVR